MKSKRLTLLARMKVSVPKVARRACAAMHLCMHACLHACMMMHVYVWVYFLCKVLFFILDFIIFYCSIQSWADRSFKSLLSNPCRLAI